VRFNSPIAHIGRDSSERKANPCCGIRSLTRTPPLAEGCYWTYVLITSHCGNDVPCPVPLATRSSFIQCGDGPGRIYNHRKDCRGSAGRWPTGRKRVSRCASSLKSCCAGRTRFHVESGRRLRHIFGVYEFRSHTRLFVVEAHEVDQAIVASRIMRRGRAVTGLTEIEVVAGGKECWPGAQRTGERPRNSRYTPDRGGFLHVQPLRGWSGAFTPTDPGAYDAMGATIAEHGYVR
jgi:hypothetical protein